MSGLQSVVHEPAQTSTLPLVFLDKQQASSLISRQKRNVDGSNPGQTSTLEKVCMEKVCTYDEARKVFQDSYRTVSSSVSLGLFLATSLPMTQSSLRKLQRKLQLCTHHTQFCLPGYVLGCLRR